MPFKLEKIIPLSYNIYGKEALEKTINIQQKPEDIDIEDNIKTWDRYAEAKDKSFRMNDFITRLGEQTEIEADEKNTPSQREAATKAIKQMNSRQAAFEKAFESYKMDREYIKGVIENAGDISKMDYKALSKLSEDLKSYDEVARQSFFEDVMNQIGRQMFKLQYESLAKLKNANPELYKDIDFDKLSASTAGLPKGSWLFKALSDMGSEHMGLQFLSREFAKMTLLKSEKKAAWRKVMEPLFQNLVKEYNKKQGLGEKLISYLSPLTDRTKYQKNLFEKYESINT